LETVKTIRARIFGSAEYHAGVEEDTVLLSVAAAESGYSAERIRKMVIAGQLDGFKEHDRYWVITRAALAELKARPKQRRGWPKGKPRKPPAP
jgi:hypothetical protein